MQQPYASNQRATRIVLVLWGFAISGLALAGASQAAPEPSGATIKEPPQAQSGGGEGTVCFWPVMPGILPCQRSPVG